jgi:adenylate cyclase class 2
MPFEVEQKHRVDDVAALIASLEARGVTIGLPVTQVDQYFAHPARDFTKTDEALRIRTTSGKSFVTYKGPRLDRVTKTRRELELPLANSDADGKQFCELLVALGFQPVASVRKQRREFLIQHNGYDVQGALDVVDDVGTFVELELTADDANLNEARQIIAALALELGFSGSERRSYLELLLLAQSQDEN